MADGEFPNYLRAWRERQRMTLEQVAEAADTDKTQISKLELGKRKLTVPWLKRFAFALHTPIEELLKDPADAESVRPRVGRSNRMAAFKELDVRAAAGNGLIVLDERVAAEWQMPADLFRGQTSATAEAIRIITVYGDSMEPELMPGVRVVVDTDDRVPTPPGVFVVFDGLATVIKRIELIPFSDPLRVRVFSDNPKYTPYEVTAEEAHIRGRVIGRWRWM